MMKILVKNRKAFHHYVVLEKIEAGLSLVGTEVKSIRDGKVNFADCYAALESNEMFIKNLDIQPYEKGNVFNHEPKRKRKLLLHRREIVKAGVSLDEKGLSLIPLMLYVNDRGRIKVELGLCKYRKNIDKRQDMDKKEASRTVRNILKSMK